MIIAQISDLHVREEGHLAYRRVDTALFLARCVEHLARLLRPVPAPVYVIPGNHDDRAALVGALADHAYLPRAGFLQYVVDDFPVRLIGLDTLVPGEGGGRLCEARLAWLAARLDEAPRRPAVIFMHHPPFPTGIEHMDRIGLRGAEAMADLVRRHPQVEAVLCGHLHRPIHVRWAGTVATTAPSPAHQVALDLRPDGPSAFVMEPPGYLVHQWREGLGLVTHVAYVGEFGGPYPFYEGGRLIG